LVKGSETEEVKTVLSCAVESYLFTFRIASVMCLKREVTLNEILHTSCHICTFLFLSLINDLYVT